ncbi:MAG: hypothetical protein CMH98_15135 [Oceanospirillaceae bacterium]|nr:hypothetical protein [Oceanospirillaceae bacterium]|tara:strand:+ start:251 stop:490 length:240 start_codon:yes stop_codon:yes gene_type:complete
MNNQVRKKRILVKIEAGEFHNVYDVLKVFGGDIESMEAIPLGTRNEPIRIAEDYTDGMIDGRQSIERLVEFISGIPDEV